MPHGYWELVNRISSEREYIGSTNATSQLGYPVGRHLWLVTDPSCDLFVPTLLNLTLSTCSEDEFTCDDGICIPSWQRCDLVQNCEDLSDELECHTVTARTTVTKSNGKKVPKFLIYYSSSGILCVANYSDFRVFSPLSLPCNVYISYLSSIDFF